MSSNGLRPMGYSGLSILSVTSLNHGGIVRSKPATSTQIPKVMFAEGSNPETEGRLLWVRGRGNEEPLAHGLRVSVLLKEERLGVG